MFVLLLVSRVVFIIFLQISGKMVSNYKRHCTHSSYGPDVLQKALDAVKSGMSKNKASKHFNVPRRTLNRHHEPVGCMSRWSREKRQRISVCQPRIVKVYNNTTGGVYRADQNVSAYHITTRTKKWWWPLFAYTRVVRKMKLNFSRVLLHFFCPFGELFL